MNSLKNNLNALEIIFVFLYYYLKNKNEINIQYLYEWDTDFHREMRELLRTWTKQKIKKWWCISLKIWVSKNDFCIFKWVYMATSFSKI